MKGVVFTEFLEMVESKHSLALVDQIVGEAQLSHGGVYTAVGTYPVEEMVALLVALSAATKTPIPDLLQAFGKHLAVRFAAGFPQFFSTTDDPLTFLESVDKVIHVEVRKLYPDAELPRFECERRLDGALLMTYQSPRRLADLAEGLILGCGEHFGTPLSVAREDLSEGTGEKVRFVIAKRGDAAAT